MTFQFSPEQERLIRKAIQAGVIENPNEIVEIGIESVCRQLNARSTLNPIKPEQWIEEFHAWVRSHPTTTPLLSDEAISRDSIYGIRGL
jgi:hypothetical protein